MDQLIRYFAPEFIGLPQTRSCWAELSPCQIIIMPGQTQNSSPCSWHNIPLQKHSCFESPFSHKRKSWKSWDLYHQVIKPVSFTRQEICACVGGWGMMKPLLCKKDFFIQLVKHTLKPKQLGFFLDKSFILTPPEFKLMLFSFLWSTQICLLKIRKRPQSFGNEFHRGLLVYCSYCYLGSLSIISLLVRIFICWAWIH